MTDSAPATRTSSKSANGASLALLVFVGAMLAASILLSKLAAGRQAPMLTCLALAMGGSGVILLAVAALMLIAGAVITLPFAMFHEGWALPTLFAGADLALIAPGLGLFHRARSRAA